MMRTIVATVCFWTITAALAVAQIPGSLNTANWTAYRQIKEVYKATPENISKEGTYLKLAGFHLGMNPQYSLAAPIATKLENKLVSVKMKFEGEFVSPEASFISLSLLGTSAQTIFWNQPCYALLLKSNKIEVQKHGKGTNPNFQIKYADFPSLGFKTFPIGKEVKVTFGIIREGAFPRWIVKINDVELFNGLDNKYGQTIRPNPNNLFIIGLFATNKEISGDDTSRSSLSISSIE